MSRAIADTACILVLPMNFIVLVSLGFRVAHIQQKENEFKLISDEIDELSCDNPHLGRVWLAKATLAGVDYGFDAVVPSLKLRHWRRSGAPAKQGSRTSTTRTRRFCREAIATERGAL